MGKEMEISYFKSESSENRGCWRDNLSRVLGVALGLLGCLVWGCGNSNNRYILTNMPELEGSRNHRNECIDNVNRVCLLEGELKTREENCVQALM